MNLLMTFIVLNILNVIIQTVKSIATVKCGKSAAALVNAVAYGLYTIVTVYTMCDLPLMLKAGIVALCNLIGVFVVKWLEEKARKEKLWKIEMTVDSTQISYLVKLLKDCSIPFNYIENIGKYTIVNCYCATQNESALVRDIANTVNAKYFVSETKKL